MSTPNFQINKNVSPLVQLNISGGLVYEGTYSASTAYTAGDVVTHSGGTFVARQNTTGNTPGDNVHWQTLAQQGSTGAAGAAGATGPQGATGAQGPQGNTGTTGAQ